MRDVLPTNLRTDLLFSLRPATALKLPQKKAISQDSACLGGWMQDGVTIYQSTAPEFPVPAVRSGITLIWPALACLSLALAAGAIEARLVFGSRFDGLLIFAAGAAVVVLGLGLLVRQLLSSQPIPSPVFEPLRDMFDSAGPGVAAIGLDGDLAYLNPSAERLLGYH